VPLRAKNIQESHRKGVRGSENTGKKLKGKDTPNPGIER